MYFYNYYQDFNANFIELIKLFYDYNTQILLTSEDGTEFFKNAKKASEKIENNLINEDQTKFDNELLWIGQNSQSDEKKVVIKLIVDNRIIKEELVAINGELNDREYIREFKLEVRRAIYRIYSQVKKVYLPWGVLTGIRPGLIIHRLLDKHFTDEDILLIMANKYYLANDKAKLILEVSKNERKFIDTIHNKENKKENNQRISANEEINEKILEDNQKISLYIGIPFCRSRCNYCSFVSHVCKEDC
jgi:oxygen-independent coproporphyrinogen-3 oxidase